MIQARVLIGGNDDYHDILTAGASLRDTLLRDGILATLHLGWGKMQRGGLETRVLVFATNGMRMPRVDQEAIAGAVDGGLGLVAIHTASVLAEEPEFHSIWLDLIGSRFAHHPPHARFKVTIEKNHEVTADIKDFEIEDELYITDRHGPAQEVLATATHEGKKHPMVTVREHGRGRVCYIALGHDARALNNPAFQGILTRAVRWAAGALDRK
jgi:hypothetical protein